MRAAAVLALALIAATVGACVASAIRVTGTAHADVLRGASARDKIFGRGGNDRLFGYAARDLLNGGRGDDVLVGGNGGDLLLGGPGGDRIDARDDERNQCALVSRKVAFASPLDYPHCADVVLAGAGDDLVLMRDGRLDVIWFCGAGRDTVIADRRDEVAGDCEGLHRR